MDDRSYFDVLYQGWARTTGAEDTYWMPEDYEDHSGRVRVYAVAQDDSRRLIASDMSIADSAFTIAMHGSLPDLFRRINDAVDEADRLDLALDEHIGRVGRLEEEADEYESVIKELTERITELESGRI
jgi:hypothetical protein